MNENLKSLKAKKNLQFFLEKNNKLKRNKAIQMSYDIRSGSSIKNFSKRKNFFSIYIEEVANLISKNFPETETVLDCGAGELVTSNLISKKLKNLKKMYCFDFSFKRLLDGKNNLKKVSEKKTLSIFSADMFNIPLPDNSIDLVTTYQALEPNGYSEYKLIKELLRVSKKGLFLMEPDFENGSYAQKRRMKKLNYIKNLPGVIKKLGQKFKVIKMKNYSNPLNKCSAYVVFKKISKKINQPNFVDPINKNKLKENDNHLYDQVNGHLYFKFNSIPILIREKALFVPFVKKI